MSIRPPAPLKRILCQHCKQPQREDDTCACLVCTVPSTLYTAKAGEVGPYSEVTDMGEVLQSLPVFWQPWPSEWEPIGRVRAWRLVPLRDETETIALEVEELRNPLYVISERSWHLHLNGAFGRMPYLEDSYAAIGLETQDWTERLSAPRTRLKDLKVTRARGADLVLVLEHGNSRDTFRWDVTGVTR